MGSKKALLEFAKFLIVIFSNNPKARVPWALLVLIYRRWFDIICILKPEYLVMEFIEWNTALSGSQNIAAVS